jgi:hypothetical protein
VFPVCFAVAGLALLPLLLVTDQLGLPFSVVAVVWLGGTTVAWGVLAWWALQRIGASGAYLLVLAATATIWAALPWVTLQLLELTGRID